MSTPEAMGHHAAALAPPLRDIERLLGQAQATGLDIPAAAAQACQILAALGLAWSYNAAGMPAPDEAKSILGLTTPPKETP